MADLTPEQVAALDAVGATWPGVKCGCGADHDPALDRALQLRSDLHFHLVEPRRPNPLTHPDGQLLRVCRQCFAVYLPRGMHDPK